MRRSEREITDGEEIDRVIRACPLCRLGFSHPDGAYVVPLSFGFSHENGERVLYFHGAVEGRKMELMRENPLVGFEMDTGCELVHGGRACDWSARFRRVIGTGPPPPAGPGGEGRALRLIMEHATGSADWTFPDATLGRTAVFQLTVREICCKAHP